MRNADFWKGVDLGVLLTCTDVLRAIERGKDVEQLVIELHRKVLGDSHE